MMCNINKPLLYTPIIDQARQWVFFHHDIIRSAIWVFTTFFLKKAENKNNSRKSNKQTIKQLKGVC